MEYEHTTALLSKPLNPHPHPSQFDNWENKLFFFLLFILCFFIWQVSYPFSLQVCNPHPAELALLRFWKSGIIEFLAFFIRGKMSDFSKKKLYSWKFSVNFHPVEQLFFSFKLISAYFCVSWMLNEKRRRRTFYLSNFKLQKVYNASKFCWWLVHVLSRSMSFNRRLKIWI